MITETEKAWLAGFLDADGMIRLRKAQKNSIGGPKSLVPHVVYTNTCTMTVTRLSEMLGRSEMPFKAAVKSHKGTSWAPKITVEMAGLTRVVPFLEMVRPFLVTKALEADLVLKFATIRFPHSRQPYGTLEFQIFEALRYLKKSRHLRDYTPSVEDILGDDIVRANGKSLEVAEMTTRQSIEQRKEWAKNLVRDYRWNRSPK